MRKNGEEGFIAELLLPIIVLLILPFFAIKLSYMHLSMPMKRLNFVMGKFLVNQSNQSYSKINNIDVRR